ncbi:hypothetical protein AAG570_005010, partial [Ranatra chinensis]
LTRFDENSKVIVVEGPIQSGKTAFAKELARQLDMHHIPDANMDMLYINQYGYDMRQLDDRLPESTRSFDEKNFCRDPKHTNAAAFQIWMYRLRFSLYIDALTHVLNTGQGVVIQRCPWSDSVFMDAMASQRYVSEGALGAYNQIVKHTLSVLMKPHLVIYLDVPADRVLENIKKKGEPFEKEGKALTKAYLHDLENNWKNKFLKEVSINSELVMYDWSNGGDVEAVVEDLERIDFDRFTKHDAKLQDWRKWREQEWSDTRIMYTNNKASLMSLFNIPIYDVPELLVNGEDLKEFNDVWYSVSNITKHGLVPRKINETNLCI